jgi:hypothetical protein
MYRTLNSVKIMKINIKPAYICMPLYCSISLSPPWLPSLCACPVTHGCTLLKDKCASDTQIRIANIAITHVYIVSFIGIHTLMHAPSAFS